MSFSADSRKQFIDLGHTVEHGLITHQGMPGPEVRTTAVVKAPEKYYAEGTEFHIGRIEMVANTGTNIDAPFHRFAAGKDLS
jgi:arylformamidase